LSTSATTQKGLNSDYDSQSLSPITQNMHASYCQLTQNASQVDCYVKNNEKVGMLEISRVQNSKNVLYNKDHDYLFAKVFDDLIIKTQSNMISSPNSFYHEKGIYLYLTFYII
jgi:hypothetical protein